MFPTFFLEIIAGRFLRLTLGYDIRQLFTPLIVVLFLFLDLGSFGQNARTTLNLILLRFPCRYVARFIFA